MQLVILAMAMLVRDRLPGNEVDSCWLTPYIYYYDVMILDANQTPVPNAVVSIEKTPGTVPRRFRHCDYWTSLTFPTTVVTADAKGRFQADFIMYEAQTLLVDAPGCLPYRQEGFTIATRFYVDSGIIPPTDTLPPSNARSPEGSWFLKLDCGAP